MSVETSIKNQIAVYKRILPQKNYLTNEHSSFPFKLNTTCFPISPSILVKTWFYKGLMVSNCYSAEEAFWLCALTASLQFVS